VANLVTRARISADLYRRQLRSVPARRGAARRGAARKKGGLGVVGTAPLYVRAVHTCRGWRHVGAGATRGII